MKEGKARERGRTWLLDLVAEEIKTRGDQLELLGTREARANLLEVVDVQRP